VVHFHELNRSIGLTVEHVKLAKQTGAKVFLTAHLSSYTCNTNILVRNKTLCNGIIDTYRCAACSYKVLFDIPELLRQPLAAFSLILKKSNLLDLLPAGSGKTLLHVTKTIERIKSDLQTLVESVDQIISYSEWYKEILIQNNVPIHKVSVVPVALVSTEDLKLKPVVKTGELPVRFVFIGRIQETKGIHLIIEAFSHFDAELAQIDVYGAIENTDYYKDCVIKSSGINSVNIKGPLQREDVVSTLSSYDMFCLASTFSEMSPLVIQESFAAGIPVLASKVYGNIEQIKHGYNGLLFDFNSSEDLKKRIEYLVNDPSIIKKLCQNIIPPNQFQMVHEAYLQIYNRTQQ
jgi:glycosyltransferase involved in cell wall biosynthesis